MSVFLDARSLYIPWADNPQHWKWSRDSGHEVVEVVDVWWLEIKGTVDTKCLVKMTSYSAHLVFKLNRRGVCLSVGLTLVRYAKDKKSYSKNRRGQVFVTKNMSSRDIGRDRFPNCRDDGWMEIKLGDFYVSSGNEGKVHMCYWEDTVSMYPKCGLIVRGIEVRPKCGEN